MSTKQIDALVVLVRELKSRVVALEEANTVIEDRPVVRRVMIDVQIYEDRRPEEHGGPLNMWWVKIVYNDGGVRKVAWEESAARLIYEAFHRKPK